MKTLYLLLLSLIVSIGSVAQSLKKMSSTTLLIGYDKTVHFIFPTQVKYAKSIDDYVAVDIPEEAQHIVRVKANERFFSKPTTISIATQDGRFYSYLATYSDKARTTYIIGKEQVPEETIEVTTGADIHIVAPQKVNYIDFGNDSITASLAEGTQNIIRLRALEKFSTPTNVSFALSNGKFYSYNITYSPTVLVASYTLEDSTHEGVILDDNNLKTNDKSYILKSISKRNRSFYSLGIQKYKQRLEIRNIYTYKEQTIIEVDITNSSQVAYDVDYIKFSIKDKSSKRRVATQDIDLNFDEISGFGNKIEASQSVRLIFVFPKFTIGEDKYLELSLVEKEGGRNINYKIDDRSLNSAISI